jgi:2-polyprenyl-6-methoxyphenol hydroxylase-like FAD-dependent oxidoreductase
MDAAVLIVGAGPTGLVLGLWLTRQGIPVRIIDKVAEPGTTSRALGVQARTLELYRQAELTDALLEAGRRVEGANLWVEGRKVARIPLGEVGRGQSPYPYLLIYPQDEHERLLIERLKQAGVTVERPVELVGFEQDGVRATLKHADGREETTTAQYLAGCDGARSFVRQTLLGDAGFPGGTYVQTFYVADVEASGPAADGELHVDVADSDFVALFPLKKTGNARLIGAVRDHPEHGKELTFEDVSDRALRQIKMKVEKVHWFSTYHVHHRVASHFKIGRAFLVGDAAHIHSPVGGQGMNTGIGDAINLAWKLAHVIKGQAPAGLLDTYPVERVDFARRLVATTDQIFTLATSPSSLTQRMRTGLLPIALPALFQLPNTRRFMFKTVSQIGIRYRHCNFNDGRAGPIHGGDRLPWVELEEGGDNFEPLKAMTWQVHVYGEASDALRRTCEELRLPLHVFPWQRSTQRARLREDALYLLRPDTYLAFVDPEQSAEKLRGFLESRQIDPAADKLIQ